MHARMILMPALLCGSCAHMDAQVDVLNPAYVEAHRDQDADRKELVSIMAQTESDIRNSLQVSRAQVYAQYDASALVYESAAAKPGAVDSGNLIAAANSLRTTAKSDFTSNLFEPTVQSLLGIKQDVMQKLSQFPGTTGIDIIDGNERLPDDVQELIHRKSAVIQSYNNSVQLELRGLAAQAQSLKLPATETAAVTAGIKGAEEQTSQYLTSLLGPNGDIAADTNAYIVAAAPTSQWHPEFNKTFVDANWGNLNTAIKLDGLADFTIKGVTFDPSKVAQVASKVTTQALLMSAQIAGVPVKLQHASSGGEANEAKSTTGASKTESQTRAQAAATQDFKGALIDIAQAILRENTEIEGPKGSPDSAAAKKSRLAAITAIQASFNAQKSRLSYSTQQTESGQKAK
jgi:hypothetical protein